MVLVVSVKLFGFIRAIARYGERLLSHKTTFTMLRDVQVQFLEKLILEYLIYIANIHPLIY